MFVEFLFAVCTIQVVLASCASDTSERQKREASRSEQYDLLLMVGSTVLLYTSTRGGTVVELAVECPRS